ncbi:MAG: NmrA family NAD(P)-binding protein [Solirubrobacterales bacterium]|nr:NmrA family NAD(P)-binding protein [Solirubrobacterales bacterium]
MVRALLARGIPVRAAVRDPAAATLPDTIETVRFDFEDARTFGPAAAGARGIFLLRPTHITKVGGTLVKALGSAAAAGVEHCVFLSVAGAARQPWIPHRKVEKALEASSLSWTFLRANHFMQNMLGPYREAILSGRLALPAGQGRVSFVDCADLGEVAALSFADPARHSGQAYHLTGPRAVSFSELAATLSNSLEREVVYEPIGAFSYWRALRRTGAPLPYATIITTLHVGVRRGVAATVDPTLPRLLQRPATTVEEFIDRNVAVFGLTAPAR